jgi:hypothetical protein
MNARLFGRHVLDANDRVPVDAIFHVFRALRWFGDFKPDPGRSAKITLRSLFQLLISPIDEVGSRPERREQRST